MRFLHLSATSLLLILALALPKTVLAQTPGDGKIYPGFGVSGAELGMSSKEVRAKLGKSVSENRDAQGRLLFAEYEAGRTGRLDIYFDSASGRVRMIVASARTFCTRGGICLYRAGDLAKLKDQYGPGLLRFTDWDGSVTYRRLRTVKGRQVMTEFTPSEERNGVVQVTILYWSGAIDDSSLGGG